MGEDDLGDLRGSGDILSFWRFCSKMADIFRFKEGSLFS